MIYINEKSFVIKPRLRKKSYRLTTKYFTYTISGLVRKEWLSVSLLKVQTDEVCNKITSRNMYIGIYDDGNKDILFKRFHIKRLEYKVYINMLWNIIPVPEFYLVILSWNVNRSKTGQIFKVG